MSALYTKMEELHELERTFIEEYEAAQMLLQREMLKAAVILYSKALFAAIDYLIFSKYGKLPKNHTERFRILRLRESKIHQDLENVWSKYTDSYSKPATAESVEIFRKVISELIRNDEAFSEKIKKSIEA